MKDNLWIVFVVMTVLTWGCYVPVLHEGQKTLGNGKPSAGSLRAFLLVGVAYLVAAVVIPGILLLCKQEPMEFNARGTTLAFLGGLAGAVGALGIILAMKTGGKPTTVPPLVFAGAPIISTLVAMAWHRPASIPNPLFFVGIVLAAIGAGLVLANRPAEAKAASMPGGPGGPAAAAVVAPVASPPGLSQPDG